MHDFHATSAVVAQAIPAGSSLLDWMLTTLSLSGLLVLVSSVTIFGGACYLVAARRRPAVLAANHRFCRACRLFTSAA